MNKQLKEKIVALRRAGKNYNEIAKELGCSKGTIAYHLGNAVKEKQYNRQFRNRTKMTAELKKAHGGKCSTCGYSKCMKALEFHHLDPTKKESEVSHNRATFAKAAAEAEKCILLCANCHRELHAKIDESGQMAKSGVS